MVEREALPPVGQRSGGGVGEQLRRAGARHLRCRPARRRRRARSPPAARGATRDDRSLECRRGRWSAISSFGESCSKRLRIAAAPISGAALEKVAPIVAAASAPTSPRACCRRSPTTRSPLPTPRSRRWAASRGPVAQLAAAELAAGAVAVAGDDRDPLVVLGRAAREQVLGVAEAQVREERAASQSSSVQTGSGSPLAERVRPLEEQPPELAEALDRPGVEGLRARKARPTADSQKATNSDS